MSLWTPSKLSGHSARRRAHNCTNGKSYKCANLQLYFCANKKSYKSANELCNCTNLHLCAVCNYIVLHFGHFLSSIGQLILHSNMHTKSLTATQLEKSKQKELKHCTNVNEYKMKWNEMHGLFNVQLCDCCMCSEVFKHTNARIDQCSIVWFLCVQCALGIVHAWGRQAWIDQPYCSSELCRRAKRAGRKFDNIGEHAIN